MKHLALRFGIRRRRFVTNELQRRREEQDEARREYERQSELRPHEQAPVAMFNLMLTAGDIAYLRALDEAFTKETVCR